MFWYNKKVTFMTSLALIRKKMGLAERMVADQAGLSRSNLRGLESPGQKSNPTLKSLAKLASQLNRNLVVLAVPESCFSDYSTLAVSYKALRDGSESWKIHYMDFVDQFRSTLDPRLLLLPPTQDLSRQLTALLASIVLELSHEAKIDPPLWALKNYFLPEPWFVSGMQSLKAIALIESPLFFRQNNIFVQQNILSRA